ncbi:J domain-containing protein [Patescibacteria group bacterium]|nr:MAG: J domain-containing protein [Patescibacteria group bacterium]
MNLYQILGVRQDASHEEIKKVYRRLARENHPDRHPDDDEKITRFKAVASAYEVLSDPVRRAVYDRESRPAASLQELLTKTVGGRVLSAMLPHAPAARRDGADRIVSLPVEDGQVTVVDPRDPKTVLKVPMPRVHQMARVAGMGAQGTGGGSPGALYIISDIKEEE